MKIELDEYGVSTVKAENKQNALFAMGYVHAKDRFFQMDLLRRQASGKLSEIFGENSLETDVKQRWLGLNWLAERHYENLSFLEKKLLLSYVNGINSYLNKLKVRPVEYFFLKCKPKLWSPIDTISIILLFYQNLAFDLDGISCSAILRRHMPSNLADFFLEEIDYFSPDAQNIDVPISQIEKAVTSLEGDRKMDAPHVTIPNIMPGSNAWICGPSITKNNNVILSNDMHLSLSIPNFWHRIQLVYKNVSVSGVVIPGTPFIVAGKNDHIVWGHTNIPAKAMSLTPIKSFHELKKRTEKIRIKNNSDIHRSYYFHDSGPVSESGDHIVQWGGYWPSSINMMFLGIFEAESVNEVIKIANTSGMPPLYILTGDKEGSIARSITGKVPKTNEEGFLSYERFISAKDYLTCINPECSFLVAANNNFDPTGKINKIGFNFPSSYRYHKIQNSLKMKDDWTELDMIDLQRNCDGDFYSFYKDLICGITSSKNLDMLHTMFELVKKWDGFCSPKSQGIAFIVEFRKSLMFEVFSHLLKKSIRQTKEIDSFTYSWRNSETVLRCLIKTKKSFLFPDSPKDWDSILFDLAVESYNRLAQMFKKDPALILWGDYHKIEIKHPLGAHWITSFFNLPDIPSFGSDECISCFGKEAGVTQRLVISPDKESEGFYEMPGGQSGNPISPFYRDHHRMFVKGETLPFKSSRVISGYDLDVLDILD